MKYKVGDLVIYHTMAVKMFGVIKRFGPTWKCVITRVAERHTEKAYRDYHVVCTDTWLRDTVREVHLELFKS